MKFTQACNRVAWHIECSYMSALVWFSVFVLSVLALVKSSDTLVDSAKKIGGYFKIPVFVTGVLVVGIGTSMPELVSSVYATIAGVPEVVIANIVGSNIANIFLIVGVSAIVAKRLKITKELIDLDIPLLVISTTLFWVLVSDGVISLTDSVFLLAGLLYYLTYTISHKKADIVTDYQVNDSVAYDFVKLILSIVVLSVSAKYLIEATISLSDIFDIGVDVISVVAIALGTSLPELFVSLSAVKKGEADIALGNIFGSNIFNMLAVGGISATISALPASELIMKNAMILMLLATAIFAVSGISRKIHSFEGVFYVIIYVYFIYSLI